MNVRSIKFELLGKYVFLQHRSNPNTAGVNNAGIKKKNKTVVMSGVQPQSVLPLSIFYSFFIVLYIYMT